MFTLKLFGTATLQGAGGPVTGRAAQGRRLALLAMLALARGRGVTRDKLVSLLLPESSTDRARHQLSDDLYIIRGGIGDQAIRAMGDELALNPEVVASDVAAFEEAIDAGRFEQAVGLMAGPLMDGFHLTDGAEFERWLDAERARLGQRHAAALEELAGASEARGDFASATGWWRTLAAQDPYSGRVALRLMRSLEAAGDRAGAIRHARIHSTLLRAEFDAVPDPEVTAFAERLRVEPAARQAIGPVSVAARPAAAAAEPAVAAERASSAQSAAPAQPAAHAEPIAPLPGSGRPPAAAAAADHRVRRGPRRRWVAIAAALLVVAAIGLRAVPSSSPPSAAGSPSVAVLPFVNMSAEPDNAYFSDGLSEQIIAQLSRIEGLRVAARTSSFALRDGRLDVRAIGDALGVAAVLEGSVRRDGSRLRVTAQLIDARTGYHIWTDEYSRDLEDIFVVQEEIANAIAAALELRLASSKLSHRARSVPDLEAYDYYLRGLYLRNDLTADALRQACDFFDKAIEREPGFALAYAGKASVVAPLVLFGHVDREKGTRDFRALTARALELDPTLGEAHVALGILRLFFDWDWQGAERALRRAIELNPSDPHAYHHLANYLRAMGRFEEAVTARARGVELDPLNARTIILLGNDYYVLGEHTRALEQYQRAHKLNPVHPLTLGSGPWMPAGPVLVHLAEERYDDAVEEYARLAVLRGASADEVSALRAGYASGGMRLFWRRWLEMDLRQTGGQRDAFRMTKMWSLIGDTTETLRWLDSAYAERNMGLLYLNTDPTLAPWRTHPRVARIVRAMQFPQR